MDILLSWSDPNPSTLETQVFVSTDPIDRDHLPAPTAVIPGGTTRYTIANVPIDSVYQVVLKVVGNNDSFVTHARTVTATHRSGPGPQHIKHGDWSCGYFGLVPGHLLATREDLKAATGVNGANTNELVNWHKFAFRGKVLFIPDRYVYYSVSWSTLYSGGAVYGTGDAGPYPTYVEPVPQDAAFTRDGFTYAIRLPEGGAPSADKTVSGHTPHIDGAGSEWNELIYRLITTYVSHKTVGNFADFPPWFYMGGYNHSKYFTVLCQETGPANQALCRGRVRYGRDTSAYDVMQNEDTADHKAWLPVLELKPSSPVIPVP